MIDAVGDTGQTSLHLAAQLGFDEIAQLLLEHGADRERENDIGSRPLHLAVFHGRQKVVERLLSYQVTTATIRNNNGNSVPRAVHMRNKHLVKLSVENDADINDNVIEGSALHNATRKEDGNVVKPLPGNGIEVNAIDSEGWHAFHFAVANRFKDMINILHRYGGDLDVTSRDRITPLSLAASEGHTETVVALLTHNADVNLGDMNQYSPLHSAACHGHEDVVELLLERGAHLVADVLGWTPLHYATRFNHRQVVALLLCEGEDQNATKYNGRISLHLAAPLSRSDGAGLLHAKSADRKCYDQTERTRSNSAADLELQDIVTSLSHGKDEGLMGDVALESLGKVIRDDHALKDLLLGAVDKMSYQTTLHLGVIYRQPDNVEILIRNGANPTLHDGYGRTCLDWARQNDQIFFKLGDAAATYEPTDERFSRICLIATVSRILQEIFSSQPPKDCMGIVGRCLFHLGDHEAGCIIFERSIYRRSETISHPAICESCDDGIEIRGRRYVCSECADTDFCELCVKKGLNNSAVPGCFQHRLIAIPRDEAACIIPGIVDDQRLTFEDWLHQILARYSDELEKAQSELH